MPTTSQTKSPAQPDVEAMLRAVPEIQAVLRQHGVETAAHMLGALAVVLASSIVEATRSSGSANPEFATGLALHCWEIVHREMADLLSGRESVQ